jgi:hypothetical protein
MLRGFAAYTIKVAGVMRRGGKGDYFTQRADRGRPICPRCGQVVREGFEVNRGVLTESTECLKPNSGIASAAKSTVNPTRETTGSPGSYSLYLQPKAGRLPGWIIGGLKNWPRRCFENWRLRARPKSWSALDGFYWTLVLNRPDSESVRHPSMEIGVTQTSSGKLSVVNESAGHNH